MDVLEAMKKRRPVKRFRRAPIPDEKLTQVLNAMRLAPSAANTQPWKFIVVRDEAVKQRLAAVCSGQKFITDAPVLVVGCANIAEAYPYLGMFMSSYPMDLAMALNCGELIAVSEGLGTHWVYQFHGEKVQEVLGIPPDIKVCFLLAVGAPEEFEEPDGRKNLSEIVCYERYE